MSGPTPGALDELEIAIDRNAPTPAYLQLRERLASAIRSGRLAPGVALPSERVLAEALRLSRMTVRRAVEALVEEGRLERRHGSGTFVRPRPVEQTVDRLLGYTDEAHGLGFAPGTTLLEVRRAPAEEATATALNLPHGTQVLVLTRLRTADDEPLAIQRAALAPAYAELSLDLLRREESLYRVLRTQFGVTPHHARQTVTARLPNGQERRWLGLESQQPVLALERVSYDLAGAPIEHVRSAYRGDRYRMALDLGAPEPAVERAPDAPPARSDA